MSNQYIEAICTMPKEIAFGYDPYDNLSLTQKAKVKAGVVRPESTVEYRWHYAKAAAKKMLEKSVGNPSSSRVISLFNRVNGAWTQFSLPPTSNKSVWYQGALALQVLAIKFGKKELSSKAQDLYISGDNIPLKTGIGDIQSAAKNVYRKAAKACEKAGLSSSDSSVKFVLNHLKGYARVSEIVFGQKLSIESSTTMQTSVSRQEKVEKEEKKVRKERGLERKSSIALPFKNKTEGNVFRAWVNDNHKGWAKANDLSRSGKYNNPYITKAWKRWGQDYQMAMAQRAFMERTSDILPATPAPVVAPMPVAAPMPMSNEPLPFDDEDPFENEDPEIGMLALLQDDPEEFLKQYWYVPAGGLVGVIGLAIGIRVLTK
jgi:hypothetical protein